jgi:hypothetical protein
MTYYEVILKKFNELETVEERREYYKTIDFSKKIENEKDAKIISELKKFIDIPFKDNNFQKKEEQSLKQVILPKENKLISSFAEEILPILSSTNKIFYRPDLKEIVEITEIDSINGKNKYLGFSTITPHRFITLIEKYIIPGYWVMNRENQKFEFKMKSMGSDLANTLLKSPQLQKLPIIERIYHYQMPIIHEGRLTFPKIGYDERFNSWIPSDAPKIKFKDMDLKKAKEIIETILKEFCFKEKQDKTNAIAGMLTPFLRGLFKTQSTRTPVFFYEANRERAGKDYLAGITGLIYEGHNLEEPPISSGEFKGKGGSDELRKKILGALIGGRRRLHFANNKGYINNAVFESIVTAEKYSDRPLGKSEILTFDNELDFSLSGNVGIGYTPDFANRCKFIRLFLDIEDANARKFENPDLHGWVLKRREEILSAFYSFVKYWMDNGKKEGKLPFASFPEWSKICGGIMESIGYGSPCVPDKEILSLGGDTETKDMKRLFELCYENTKSDGLTKMEIRNIITNSEEDIFAYYDFDKRPDQTKFAMKLAKFVGRILSDIRMGVVDPNVRSARQKYVFQKEIPEKINDNLGNNTIGNHGKGGNLPNQSKENNKNSIRVDIVTRDTTGYHFNDEKGNFGNLTEEEVREYYKKMGEEV